MRTGEKGLCSVCCVGYRHAAFLEQNIRAIWDGEYRHIEIIALDDGSHDGSIELLESLTRQSPFPMTVIAQENTGNVGRNFNTALRAAHGEYVTFMSLDDVLYPDAVSKAVKLMEADPHLAFVTSSKMMGIDEYGNIFDDVPDLALDTLVNPSIDELIELEYQSFSSLYIQGTIFRKNIVDNVGGFDEDMTGDDLILRTKIFLYIKKHVDCRFSIIKEPSFYYRIHDNNIHRHHLRQIKTITEYLDRYWPERENPKVLIDWTIGASEYLPFEEYIKIFPLNSRAASMLLDTRIQAAIKKSARKFKNSWISFIFTKEKLHNKKRKITLFSCIKFSYRKKRRNRKKM